MKINYNLIKIGNSSYGVLQSVRNFLAKNPRPFPINKCQHASRFLKSIFNLEEIAREYLGNGVKSQFHAWNYDKKLDLYVDITMNQFNFKYNLIEILPVENFLLKKNSKNTKRHIIYANNFLDDELSELVAEFKCRIKKNSI